MGTCQRSLNIATRVGLCPNRLLLLFLLIFLHPITELNDLRFFTDGSATQYRM
jgi:hypothetical protein